MSSNGYNFSERVRRVLSGAREESLRLHHEYVGTEHILLSLVHEQDGVARAVLDSRHIEQAQVKQQIGAMIKHGSPGNYTGPDLPYTSRAKKVLELAMSEAREFNHNYVGTEHLLLGLLREEKGVAAQVLVKAGLTLDAARVETLRILGTGSASRPNDEQSSHLYTPRDVLAQPQMPAVMSKPVASVSIQINYADGSVRNEEFSSTMAALGFLGAVHRRQMDS